MAIKKDNILLGKREAETVIKENFIISPPVLVNQICENYGLFIFETDFEDDSISGYIDLKEKKVFINRNDSFYRKNFTISYELGHWIMHKNIIEENEEIGVLYRKPIGAFDKSFEAEEIQAKSFAAHILVPEFILKKEIEKSDIELSKLFKVSQSVIGFRRVHWKASTIRRY